MNSKILVKAKSRALVQYSYSVSFPLHCAPVLKPDFNLSLLLFSMFVIPELSSIRMCMLRNTRTVFYRQAFSFNVYSSKLSSMRMCKLRNTRTVLWRKGCSLNFYSFHTFTSCLQWSFTHWKHRMLPFTLFYQLENVEISKHQLGYLLSRLQL